MDPDRTSSRKAVQYKHNSGYYFPYAHFCYRNSHLNRSISPNIISWTNIEIISWRAKRRNACPAIFNPYLYTSIKALLFWTRTDRTGAAKQMCMFLLWVLYSCDPRDPVVMDPTFTWIGQVYYKITESIGAGWSNSVLAYGEHGRIKQDEAPVCGAGGLPKRLGNK